MAEGPMKQVVRQIQRMLREEDAVPDGDLLQAVAHDQDETAFVRLVRRYGPMVRGVCLRVLRDEHDADDAFQAVFMVLAKKAGSVRSRTSLGGWLHRVALNAALKSRAQIARRRLREKEIPMPSKSIQDQEVRALLDEELGRLPDRHRLPLVLYYFEGKSQEQVADRLGCPAGSVWHRVQKAVEALRLRLAGRGVTLSASALAGILSSDSLLAVVPKGLAEVTVKNALWFALPSGTLPATLSFQTLYLARETMHSVFLRKAVGILLILLTGVSGLGLAVAFHQQGKPEQSSMANDADAPRVDALGDALPRGVLHRLGTGRFCHDRTIQCMGYSPDGKRIISGCEGGYVCVWDSVDGRKLAEFHGKGRACGAALTSDGKYAVAAFVDGVRVWELATGNEKLLADSASVSNFLAVSPDGKRVASCQETSSKAVIRALADDMPPVKITLVDKVGGNGMTSGRFTSDGKKLVTGTLRNYACVWDAATGKELDRIGGKKALATVVALSSDDRLLAITGNQVIEIWDVEKKVIACEFLCKEKQRALAFSPGGKQLVSASDTGIMVHDLARQASCTLCANLERGRGPSGISVSWSPDGKCLCAGGWDHGLQIWDPTAGKRVGPVVGQSLPVTEISCARAEALVATTDGGPVVHVWHAGTGKRVHSVSVGGSVTSIALLPDGKSLITANADHSVVQWDVESGKEIRVVRAAMKADKPRVGTPAAFLWPAVALSPDGSLLATMTGADSSTVEVLDMGTHKQVTEFKLADPLKPDPNGTRILFDRYLLVRLAFSPDGGLLAAGGSNHALSVFDVQGKRLKGEYPPPKDGISSIAFMPKGKYVATGAGSLDSRRFIGPTAPYHFRAWKLSDHDAPVASFEAIWNGAGMTAFSLDSKTLILGCGRKVRFIETATWTERRSVDLDTEVTSIVAGPGSGQFCIGGGNSSVLIFSDRLPSK